MLVFDAMKGGNDKSIMDCLVDDQGKPLERRKKILNVHYDEDALDKRYQCSLG